MAGHRDTLISVTVGSQVKGLKLTEQLIDSIWGPAATMDAVAEGIRGYLTSTIILAHNIQNGGTLADSEMYVGNNSGPTE